MPALNAKLAARIVAAAYVLAAPTTASALPSDLVSAFGTNGIVAFDPRPGTVRGDLDPRQVKALGDGSMIVAGQTEAQDIFVAKVSASGMPDPSFGVSGIRTFAPGVATFDDPYGLAIDSLGRIVVGGRMGGDAFVARLTASGALDATFDGDGLLLKTDPGGFGIFSDVEVDGTGIYALRSGSPARLYRYTDTGADDVSFGAAGVSTAAAGMNDTKLAVGPDRRVTVAGSISGSGYRVFTVRGVPEVGLSGNYSMGPVDFMGGPYIGDFAELAVGPTGDIHLVGGGVSDGFELIRTNAAGVQSYRVTSTAGPGISDQPYAFGLLGSTLFVGGGTGTGGFVEARSAASGALAPTFNGGAARPVSCAVATDCPIRALDVGAGDVAVAADQNDKGTLLGRLTTSGSGNVAFSSDGFDVLEQRIPWGTTVVDSERVADGSIYVVGYAGLYNDESTFVAKQLPSGQLDPAFGTGGIIVADLRAASPDYVSAMTVDTTGRVYVAEGLFSPSTDLWRFTAGGLDATFGVGGKVTIALPGANNASTSAMATDGETLMLGGSDFFAPATYKSWFLRVSAATGAPDPSFHGGAPRFVDQADGGNGESIWQLFVAGDRSVIASGKADTTASVIKLTPAGAPDAGFGVAGVASVAGLGAIDPGRGGHVAATPTGELILAATVTDTTTTKVAVARLSASGTLDASYGTAGIRFVGTGNGLDEGIRTLLVDAEGRAVLGGVQVSTTQRDSLLMRLTAAGAPDEQFAPGGMVVRDLSRASGRDEIASVHLRGSEVHAVGDLIEGVNVGVGKVFIAAHGEPRPPAPAGTPAPVPPAVAKPVATSTITRLKGRQPYRRAALRIIRGTARSTGGQLRRVQVSIRRIERGRCAFVTGKNAKIRRTKAAKAGCSKPVWLTASGTSKWTLALTKALPAGRYEIRSRAVLVDGTTEAMRSTKNAWTVRLK